MLCIHIDIFNKPDLIVNDWSTSTSHASDYELDSIDIKPVIEDTACLDNSCLTNNVMPKSKELGIQGDSQLDYVDFKFISLPLAIVRIDCTIVRMIEPQRLLVVLRNGIFKGTYLA
jgi:hypothetical protein